MSEINKVSEAFLNRFEKYEFDFEENANERITEVKDELENKFFAKIKKVCNENELNHY